MMHEHHIHIADLHAVERKLTGVCSLVLFLTVTTQVACT
jgi:hypothetical protein